MADRHKSTPKAVRMPAGLRTWFERHAEATGRSVNAALVAALEDYRTRRETPTADNGTELSEEPGMTTIDYPNREHERADKAARRRALAALDRITDQARYLAHVIDAEGTAFDINAAKNIADEALAVAVNLSALETLRDVREWHAADLAAAQESAAR